MLRGEQYLQVNILYIAFWNSSQLNFYELNNSQSILVNSINTTNLPNLSFGNYGIHFLP